jgi:small-conductance mechanosensitive channel
VQAVWVARYERALAGLIWILFALHLSGLLPEFADALDGVVLPLGKQHVSVLTLVNGVFSIAVTLLIALWIGRLFEQRLMSIESLDLSLRVVVNKIVRTVLIVVAVLIALPLVGIDLTVLSVFGGAVGVGLGFGLQKVASNYVSGFIILLDGSIRIGDLVSIDGRQGTISKITSRYVLLKLSDGSEAIIPNEALITSTVLNLSLTDRLSYITLPVRVAYGTDLDAVRTLLSAMLSGQPRVLAEPMPQVFVKGLAESGIDLELGFWIGDLQSGVTGLRSDLYLLIWRAFNEHGIEIPYPRRDLYLIGEPGKVDPNQSSSAR